MTDFEEILSVGINIFLPKYLYFPGQKKKGTTALHPSVTRYNLTLLLMYRALLGNTTLLNYLRAKGEIGDEQITQLKQLLPGAVPRQPSPPPPQFTIPGLGGPPPAFSPLPQVSCCQPSFFSLVHYPWAGWTRFHPLFGVDQTE